MIISPSAIRPNCSATLLSCWLPEPSVFSRTIVLPAARAISAGRCLGLTCLSEAVAVQACRGSLRQSHRSPWPYGLYACMMHIHAETGTSQERRSSPCSTRSIYARAFPVLLHACWPAMMPRGMAVAAAAEVAPGVPGHIVTLHGPAPCRACTASSLLPAGTSLWLHASWR